MVDNQPITLYFDSDKNTAFDAYDTITSYEYAYHGYAKPKNQTSVIFAQGQPTPLENIPATGVATYNGKAVHIDNATISHRDVNFNINFADKTFTGQIAIADKSRAEYELAGVVKDNQLANASITAPFIKGGFYGPNAEEIAGVYSIYENGSVVGSFGAEKQ